MPQPELIALVGASYGTTLFAVHRMGVWRRRAEGPDLRRLRRFDLRVLLRDLEPVYRAGLPREAAAPVQWPTPAAWGAEPLAPASPWESPTLSALRNSRDALFAGEAVEALPGPEFISLAIHAWLRALAHGEAAKSRAAAVTLADSSPTIAAKLSAFTDLVEADRLRNRGEAGAGYRLASRAASNLRRLGSRASDADLSSRYLDAFLRLAHLTNGWNLEVSVYSCVRFLRRSISEVGHDPCLYLALALAAALVGRSEEAVDELGRAVYYAQGDPFYSALALQDDYVARIRPALVAQCRAATEANAPPAPLAPRPPLP